MEKPEEQWIIVENTHEAIIDQATFETVQQRVTVFVFPFEDYR